MKITKVEEKERIDSKNKPFICFYATLFILKVMIKLQKRENKNNIYKCIFLFIYWLLVNDCVKSGFDC